MDFVKITRAGEVHNGVAFVTGVNVDPRPWDCTRPCSPGGIYFCRARDALFFSTLYEDAAWVRSVFPADGEAVHEEAATRDGPAKFKAHAVVLGDRTDLRAWVAGNMNADEVEA